VIWHLLTGEYPPECGGVGDYSALLVRGLMDAGDTVHLWTPKSARPDDEWAESVGERHDLPDRFGPETRDALTRAVAAAPGVLLLQYVPNALGAKGANLAFCRWLRGEAQRGADIRVMFHEPFFYFSLERPWRNALAVIQRMMAAELIKACRCLYVSSDAWLRCLEPYGNLPPALTLPIPSTIPDREDPEVIREYRASMRGTSGPVIGHFGTYGDHIATELSANVPAIAEQLPSATFAFIGERSTSFREQLASRFRSLATRTWASGRLSSARTASALRACDLLLQTYPDGVTTRRTSVMAGLANGVPTVTTEGFLTERVWRECRPAALVPAGDVTRTVEEVCRLLRADAERAAVGRRGQQVYVERFSMERTIAALRAGAPALVPAGP
jgi:hypothetical protein